MGNLWQWYVKGPEAMGSALLHKYWKRNIADPLLSPLYVSELWKSEESDLTSEIVTAKNEHVTIFHRRGNDHKS